MFFVFHILVITIYLSVINSHSVKDKYVLDRYKGYRENYSTEDVAINESSLLPTHRPMVQIIQNLTKVKRTNLKSNIFDKMLAGEMFSIKQRFRDKDMTHTSLPQSPTKTNGQKPTLEIRQKWPIIKLLEKANIDKLNDFEGRIQEDNKLEANHSSVNADKVVGVRSLSGKLRHMQEFYDMHPNSIAYPEFNSYSEPAKVCNFFKTSTLCSRQESSTQKVCSHTQKSRLQTAPVFTYIPIWPYGAPTQNPFVNLYYQDTPVDWKIPKQEELYYEDIAATEDTHENKIYKDYYNYKIRKPSRKEKNKHSKNKVVINVQYAQKTEEPEAHLNKFTQNIGDDLNKLYGDTFMKKCYCSLSLRTCDAEVVLYFTTLIVIVFHILAE